MRADPAWQAARAIPRAQQHERNAAFSQLREQDGFAAYALHEAGTMLRVRWLAEHLDAVLAHALASRAWQALNRVCLGQARRVRFKSRGRGLASIEKKRHETGLRFVLAPPAAGHQGAQLLAVSDGKDPVGKYGSRAGARRPESPSQPTPESTCLW
jgi:hypothetical protein